MADADIVGQHQREAGIGMQHRAFLHIAIAAYGDVFIVTTYRHLEPDTGVIHDGDASDYGRGIRDVSRSGNVRGVFA
ncbi:hypothetical protein D3C81_1649100 [compost metagenome]